MKKIVDYCVVCGGLDYDDDKGFEKRVNNAIKEGWQPLGGMCNDCYGSEDWGFQAMVKYEESNEETTNIGNVINLIDKKCPHCGGDNDGKIYTSIPPQYKCKKCGRYYPASEY